MSFVNCYRPGVSAKSDASFGRTVISSVLAWHPTIESMKKKMDRFFLSQVVFCEFTQSIQPSLYCICDVDVEVSSGNGNWGIAVKYSLCERYGLTAFKDLEDSEDVCTGTENSYMWIHRWSLEELQLQVSNLSSTSWLYSITSIGEWEVSCNHTFPHCTTLYAI